MGFNILMMHYLRNLTVVLLVVVFNACTNPASEEIKNTAGADSVKLAESIRTNISFLNDYNAIEQVMGNENWLLADKKDSSYFYFSRLGSFNYNTYVYRLSKGDSSHVIQDKITMEGDKLVWHFDEKKLQIVTATSARIVWAVAGNDSMKYEFTRLNDHELSLTYPGKRSYTLKKTIPFSLFLVRSRYDFAHGTKLAFDTTGIKQKS